MLATDPHLCLKCGGCIPVCQTEALILLSSGITCDNDLCIDCGDCVLFCPVIALELSDD